VNILLAIVGIILLGITALGVLVLGRVALMFMGVGKDFARTMPNTRDEAREALEALDEHLLNRLRHTKTEAETRMLADIRAHVPLAFRVG